ncbi:type II toxin-antitoxin system Phd/YefM family antitoxin [Nitratifractor sp.]
MKAVVYSHARNNLREMINRVCDDMDEYLIHTKDEKSAVLISYDEYASMRETLYLMASSKNRQRLDEAIDQIEKAEFTLREIEE